MLMTPRDYEDTYLQQYEFCKAVGNSLPNVTWART